MTPERIAELREKAAYSAVSDAPDLADELDEALDALEMARKEAAEFEGAMRMALSIAAADRLRLARLAGCLRQLIGNWDEFEGLDAGFAEYIEAARAALEEGEG